MKSSTLLHVVLLTSIISCQSPRETSETVEYDEVELIGNQYEYDDQSNLLNYCFYDEKSNLRFIRYFEGDSVRDEGKPFYVIVGDLKKPLKKDTVVNFWLQIADIPNRKKSVDVYLKSASKKTFSNVLSDQKVRFDEVIKLPIRFSKEGSVLLMFVNTFYDSLRIDRVDTIRLDLIIE